MDNAEPKWFSPDIDRRTLKALMQRNDWNALIRFAVWFGAVVGSGTLAYLSLGTSWMVPARRNLIFWPLLTVPCITRT